MNPFVETGDVNPFWEDDRKTVDSVTVRGVTIARGSRVQLYPRSRADIFDIALAGKSAVVESIEQDLEDNIQIAVTVEDDPGRDLGELLQPGHRFFFSTEEIVPIGPGSEGEP